MNLYHGGAPGLQIGDLILPGHSRDDKHPGCPICKARKAKERSIDPPSFHQDRVYVTVNRLYARYYASLYGKGDLYLVRPVGDMERTDEDPFECYTAEAARVLAVIDRAVLLRPSERRKCYLQHARVEGISKKQALQEYQSMVRSAIEGRI